MTTLVIGSVAAKHWFPDWREPKDYDVFSDEPVEHPDLRVEPFWDDRLADLLAYGGCRIATPDELATIKWSHLYWDLRNGSWNKHMFDLTKLREHGAQLIPEWHDILYAIWEDVHGKKQVDFDQEKGEFFSDAVTRIYDHDSLHRSVAYTPGQPIYETVLKDGHSVKMDMAKVWALPIEQQVKLFREEIYVTALERLVIPSGYIHSPGAAYQWALRRTITSLTRGRSAKFIIEHFDEFRRPDMDYVSWHRRHADYLIKLEAA